MYFIYILQSLKDWRSYVGYSRNIQNRLVQHNAGQVSATKDRRPLKLIFFESFETEQQAKKRELYWKSGAGRRKMKSLFNKKIK
jgi:putative endonuclease